MTETQPMNEAPKGSSTHGVWRGRLRVSLWGMGIVGMSALVLLASLSYSRPLQISAETTYLTGPLKSDGEQVDYCAAIRQAIRVANAATDENGYRLLVRHLGKPPDVDAAHFARLCEELGLDAEAIRPDMTYQQPYEFLTDYAESDALDEALIEDLLGEDWSRDDIAFQLDEGLWRPWTLDDLPMMARWLEKNGPALDLIGRAVRKPTFYIPLARQSEDDLLIDIQWARAPAVQHMRSVARGLAVRAYHRIAEDDLDGALDDIIACRQLGRHVRSDAFVFDWFVGSGIEGMADAFGIAGSLEHPPSMMQLQRLLDETDDLPPEAGLHKIMRCERLAGLDHVQAFAHGKGNWRTLNVPDDVPTLTGVREDSPTYWYGSLGFDWNIVATRFNLHYDTMMTTGEGPPPVDLDSLPHPSFLSYRARSRHVADVFGQVYMPSLQAVRNTCCRSTCFRRVARITRAMLLYEREHGTLPPAWSVDAEGNPLHSWRVLLLPYLGHHALYQKIRLDEPWDSEYNRQFHAEAVPFYRCPSDPEARLGETTYSVVVGPDTPFEAGEGKRLAEFGPGSADMILLVERVEPLGWMEPTREVPQSIAEKGILLHDDLYGTPAPKPNGIASHHPGIVHVGLRNGAARGLPQYIGRPERFRKMLDGTNAGKPIDY